MAETKPKQSPSLRAPGPKKKLGLMVPPPLRMPHDDLIHPEDVTHPAAPSATRSEDETHAQVITAVNTTVDTPVESTVITPVVTPAATVVEKVGPSESVPASDRAMQPQYLDATHTASEQRVYSVMYRETISKGLRERHYGPKELCEKTGIRSDKTVRVAVHGLIEKLSVEVVSHHTYHPLGPRYRVYEPKEIVRRRRAAGMEIDPQSKKIATLAGTAVATTVIGPVATTVDGGGKTYSSTGAETTGVTPVNSTGVISNKYENDIGGPQVSPTSSTSNSSATNDDERAALSDVVKLFSEATQKLTGRGPREADRERWAELARVLVAELEIAAARTTVSSVPSFLAEHLRRRLWKIDKQQARAEGRELPDETVAAMPDVRADDCPDCGGSGWYYPEGTERGVAKCRHVNLANLPH